MNAEVEHILKSDNNGAATYEYLVNNMADCDVEIERLAAHLVKVDRTGKYTASAARFLYATDSGTNGEVVRELVSATIDKDRDRQYLADILWSIYGEDYEQRAAELSQIDDNFRRIYKRISPSQKI